MCFYSKCMSLKVKCAKQQNKTLVSLNCEQKKKRLLKQSVKWTPDSAMPPQCNPGNLGCYFLFYVFFGVMVNFQLKTVYSEICHECLSETRILKHPGR